jgi:hypothetical protein
MQIQPVIIAVSFGVILIGAAAGWLAFQLGKRREKQAISELVTLNEIGIQLLRSKLDVDDLCELVAPATVSRLRCFKSGCSSRMPTT